jgi:hypothetical protein
VEQALFEGARKIVMSIGVLLRAIPALVSTTRFLFHLTPKNRLDPGGWPSVRLLWLPFTLGILTAVVVVFRWVDVVVFDQSALDALPAIAFEILVVVTLFALVEIVILAQVFRDLMTRRQERALWRVPVRLPAYVDGHPATATAPAIDRRPTGARFFAPRAAIEGTSVVPIRSETRQLKVAGFICHGEFTIRNIRTVTAQPDMVWLGGFVTWSEVDWLNDYLELAIRAQQQPASAYALSPLL